MDNRDIIINAMDVFYGTSCGIIMEKGEREIKLPELDEYYTIRSRRNNEYICICQEMYGSYELTLRTLVLDMQVITGMDKDILKGILTEYILEKIKVLAD